MVYGLIVNLSNMVNLSNITNAIYQPCISHTFCVYPNYEQYFFISFFLSLLLYTGYNKIEDDGTTKNKIMSALFSDASLLRIIWVVNLFALLWFYFVKFGFL